MNQMTVGIVGLRGHALRLRNALEPIARVTKLFHPSRKIDDPRCTLAFEDLYGCDGIVIASPNDTHLGYLMKLKGYPGKVYCEKPGPIEASQPFMQQHGPDPRKLMYGFTYRYSDVGTTLFSNVAVGTLGKLLGFKATVGYGLAYRPGYDESWRASRERHPLGVIETLGVHFIDLMLRAWSYEGNLFRDVRHDSWIVSGNGHAFDTSHIRLRMDGGAVGDITVSYAMPYTFDISVVGTDGTFAARDGKITVRGPRDSFDDRGFFTTPPIIHQQDYDPEKGYDEAIARSMEEFVTRRSFPIESYQTMYVLSAFKGQR